MVYAGPRMSLTAANAEERLLVRPGQERLLALGMLHTLAAEGKAPGWAAAVSQGFAPEAVAEPLGVPAEYVRKLARRFSKRGRRWRWAGRGR